MKLNCTTSAINDFANFGYVSACDYANEVCAEETSTVDFFELYYCHIHQNVPIFLVFAVVFLFLAFFMLSSTAEDFLEPILSSIASKLKFSESLAGVTLVALANGAPDVFSSIAAAGDGGADGITLSVGALFGAGCFVASVVFAIVLLSNKGKSMQVEAGALNRDCIFFVVGVLWILFQGLRGEIGMMAAIGLFVNYFAFIGAVVWQEFKYKKEEDERNLLEEQEALRRPSFEVKLTGVTNLTSLLTDADGEEHGLSGDINGNGDDDEEKKQPASEKKVISSKILRRLPSVSDLIKSEHIPAPEPIRATTYESPLTPFEIAERSLDQINLADLKRNPKQLKRQGTHSNIVKMRFQYHQLRHKAWNEMKDLKDESCFGRILSLVKAPFNTVRNFTIPSCTEEKWSKNILTLQPFLTTLFCLWQFGLLDDLVASRIAILGFVAFASVSSFFIWRKTFTKTVPEGLFGLFLQILGFVVCIVWINYVANIFVDFIHLLSVLSGLPSSYLGLTLLAWGNSMSDLFVDAALARKGLGQVAVSGIFAGQFFNLSIGFGISLIRKSLMSSETIVFDLLAPDSVNTVCLILIISSAVIITSTVIYGFISKYTLKKAYGFYLIGCYVVFFILATGLSVDFSKYF